MHASNKENVISHGILKIFHAIGILKSYKRYI